jgi:hypothetical protein
VNKPINYIIFIHAYTFFIFFSTFFIFSFLFFWGWAQLSPARPLAQASGLAGLSNTQISTGGAYR